MADKAEKPDKPKDTRSVQQIREQMAAARARMSASVEGLVVQSSPTTIKTKAVEDVKAFAQEQVHHAEAPFKDSTGGWRTDRLVMLGGAIGGIIAFLLSIRAIVKRRKRR